MLIERTRRLTKNGDGLPYTEFWRRKSYTTEDACLRFRIASPSIALACTFLAVAASSITASSVAASESAGQLLQQASAAAAAADSQRAVTLASAAIEEDPELAAAYYLRGRERFRLGKIDESLRDFDKYVALRPDVAPRQWERGIACYYAGKFREGAEQFELYQTYHNNDVENSVWRYLCMVPDAGADKARAAMLPIANDRRVPLMQIYDLFRGLSMPEDVLQAVEKDDPSPQTRAAREFYAHLYLGLYYDASGDPKRAHKFIQLAAAPQLAENPGINRYMWDVARVHARRLQDADDNDKHATTSDNLSRPDEQRRVDW